MSGILSRGSRIRFNKYEYTVDGVIAIDQNTITYAIDGDGPARLLTMLGNAPVNVELIDDDKEAHYLDVEPFYHYIFDWETGVVKEKLAYGLVIPANDRVRVTRHIIFSPYYVATLTESQIGGVTRDYQLITRESDYSGAVDAILDALKTRKKYFEDKSTSYAGAIERLEKIEF